jgi:tRNA dimethylallyltransferase
VLEPLPKKDRQPHIYVVGQTASGKSDFSLTAAEKLGLNILNTDSLLFYKGLDLGTAKPSKEELNRVKHHLIDVCEVGDNLIASTYVKHAHQVLSQNKSSFLCVGGSGFYINALDVGLLPLPETDPEIKKQVAQIKDPVAELLKLDPGFFSKISKNDTYRVSRALEVYKQTGKTLSDWQKDFNPSPFAKKMAFYWERTELKKRVVERTNSMINKGLIEEVEALLRKGLHDWKPLSSVGYFQVRQFLDGELKSIQDLKDEIILRTMQLSKRQKTWFKKDKSVKWFQASEQKQAFDFLKTAFEEKKWRA